MKKLLYILLGLSLLGAEPEPVSTAGLEEAGKATSLDVLEGLFVEIKELESQENSQLSEKEQQDNEMALKRLRRDFDELLVGKESVAYFSEEPAKTTLQEDLVAILDPFVGEVKSATADSRDREALRNQIASLEQRKYKIDSALTGFESYKRMDDRAGLSPELTTYLDKKYKLWKSRLQRTDLQLESARLQLEEKEHEAQNAVESASKVVGKFFKTRGFHLILAIFLSGLTWFLMTFAYKGFVKISPFHNKKELFNTSKTIDGAVHIAIAFFSLFTLILTFYLCDDWMLLSSSLLVFVGIFWALKDKFSDIAEELRLILNIGSVREGERIIFEGLSWKVDKIRVYSQLVNNELEGGLVRIPLNALVGLHSRPCRPTERYFPTSLNDWVLLADGVFGKVLHQTPEYVELIQLGGSRKTYTTPDFLAQAPENLSTAGFRISSAFGIDYKHQPTVTGEIQELFYQDMHQALKEKMDNPEYLKRLKVEFASAAASSLDFSILADFSREAAPKYNELTRLIQKLAVDTCNKHQWEIPFTQVTIHQAEA